MAMAPLLLFLTLCISQLINCTHLIDDKRNWLLECPDISKNGLVKECSSAKATDVFNISDSNFNDVLCTVYLYNIWRFVDNSIHKCDELLSEQIKYNSTICENFEFLIINKTDKPNHLNLKAICEKLCINWNQTINVKCNSAKYYYDHYKLRIISNITQESSSNNSSLNDQTNTRVSTNRNEPRESLKTNITNIRAINTNTTLISDKINGTSSKVANVEEDSGTNIFTEMTSFKGHLDDKRKEKGIENEKKEISPEINPKEDSVSKTLNVSVHNLSTTVLKKNNPLVRKEVSDKIDAATQLTEMSVESYTTEKNQIDEDEVTYKQKDVRNSKYI